jgi:hypothetical protein
MQKVQGAPCTDNANAPNTEASKIRDDGVGGTVMSDDVVMKVSQRRAVTVASARRDPVVRAGLDYIGGPKNVLDMKDRPSPMKGFADYILIPEMTSVPENLRNRTFINYQRYGKDAARVTAHELSHAASRRFWDDVESEKISPSVWIKSWIDRHSIRYRSIRARLRRLGTACLIRSATLAAV